MLSKEIDYHCHYTGSLSIEYVSKCLDERHKHGELTDLDFVDIPKFGNDWFENYLNFFRLYGLIQRITKPGKTDIEEQYRTGAEDITAQYCKEGVKEFQLRIGPRLDIDETRERLKGMINGFAKIEQMFGRYKVGKMVLTFIQDDKGNFSNVSENSIQTLLNMLSTDWGMMERIIGFDFSGPEEHRDYVSIQRYFQELNAFRGYAERKGKSLELMVHIGEFVDAVRWEHVMFEIEELVAKDVDRISHGTVIWIAPELVSPDDVVRVVKKQDEILRMLAKKGTHLEICPTANIILSPLSRTKKIPITRLEEIGVRYSINTDNRTIFNTHLQKEIELCGLN